MADVYKLTTDEFITQLKTVEGVNNVEPYSNQFSKDSPYINNPPEIFVEFSGTKVFTHSADQQIESYAMEFILYVVAVDLEALNSLTFLKRITDFIDGKTLTPAGAPAMTIIAGSSKLMGSLEGGARIFMLECEIY